MVSVSHRRREASFGFRDGSTVSSEGIDRFSPLAVFREGLWANHPGVQALPIFSMKAVTQTEAVRHIKNLLLERGIDIASRSLQQWIIFEHRGKQIGVDSSSGVWIRELEGDWQCLAMPCSVSGAIQAVEFLTNEEARPV